VIRFTSADVPITNYPGRTPTVANGSKVVERETASVTVDDTPLLYSLNILINELGRHGPRLVAASASVRVIASAAIVAA